MKLLYKYNEAKMKLTEKQNEGDVEFNLILFDKEVKKKLLYVKKFFDENNIFTDLLIYTHSDKSVQIIVRNDFYLDFILQLFKHHLVEEVKWGS